MPNIVDTVKGEANFEQETLLRVVEARAKAASIQATPELLMVLARLRAWDAEHGNGAIEAGASEAVGAIGAICAIGALLRAHFALPVRGDRNALPDEPALL